MIYKYEQISGINKNIGEIGSKLIDSLDSYIHTTKDYTSKIEYVNSIKIPDDDGSYQYCGNPYFDDVKDNRVDNRLNEAFEFLEMEQ